MKFRGIAILAAVAVSGVASAGGNLISNGLFEDLPGFPNPTSLLGTHFFGEWSSIPGWAAVDDTLDGTTGEPIEVGDPNLYVQNPVANGSVGNDLELNSNDPAEVVQQPIADTAGNELELTFLAAARNVGGGETTSQFKVLWDGHAVTGTIDPTVGKYSLYTVYVKGTGSDSLGFASVSALSGDGGEIENVKLVASPGPAAALPMVLGFAAKLRKRRRSK